MREYSRANEHGLNYPEARKFLNYAANQADWDGDPFFAEHLRKRAAQYPVRDAFEGEYMCKITSPDFDNQYWNEWRHKHGETAWECMARRRKEWQQKDEERRLRQQARG